MPGGINRIPDGIAGFLGIKNSGRMPDALSDQLVATWDLSHWYLNVGALYNSNSGGVAALGNLLQIQCPQDQVWYVTDYSVTIEMAAAASATFAICRFNQNQSQFVTMGEFYNVGGAAIQIRSVGWNFPLLLAPGEGLGIAIMTLVGAGTVGSQIRYRPMQT